MTLNEILHFAHAKQASDIHISAGEPIALRIDGKIMRLNTALLDEQKARQLIEPMLSTEQLDILQRHKQVDLSFEIADLARFRVNIFYQQRGIAAVFRIIPSQIPTLQSLGLPDIFYKLCTLRQGLVLVTGATGSGKSTTLAAMINHINETHNAHILTIEDPVEFLHQSKQSIVNQRQIHQDATSFQDALSSALREDPDVILIGEMRDLDSIRLALTAAETGHLVFATLHTNSAAKACDRIVDVFGSSEKDLIRTMLSESLQAVICQTLVPKTPTGRTAAYEIMVANSAVRNLIRENKIAQLYNSIQTGAKDGMITLDAHLEQLLAQGIISSTTYHQYAKNPNNL